MLDGKIVICRGRRMKYRLIEICAGITDGSHNPPAGGCKSDYMMISSKNVFDDEITLDDPRYLTEDQFNQENNRTRVASGDVLMTIVGTVGRTAVVPNDFVNITLQRSVAVFHTNNDICKSRYLMYLLRAKRHYFESEAHGVAQKGIYLKLEQASFVKAHLLKWHIKCSSDNIFYLVREKNLQVEESELLF